MNWKTGFIRIWVVASALWIVLIGAVEGPSAWQQLIYQPTGTKPPECLAAKTARECADLFTKAGKNPFDAFDFADSVFSDQSHVANVAKVVGPFLYTALIPPLGLLALGILVAWVVSGFRPTSRE